MKPEHKLLMLDNNPFKVNDKVKLLTTKRLGTVTEIRDDFCKIEFTDEKGGSCFLDFRFLEKCE